MIHNIENRPFDGYDGYLSRGTEILYVHYGAYRELHEYPAIVKDRGNNRTYISSRNIVCFLQSGRSITCCSACNMQEVLVDKPTYVKLLFFHFTELTSRMGLEKEVAVDLFRRTRGRA